MSKVLVSIAMCTYNGERFIKEQLDSILNQSYLNIELIITDDGSTDKTIEILEEYQKKDTRIKVHKNEKKLGFIKNFEKAISLTKGEYIALADQDDVWKKNKIERFLEEIKENILIYSDALLIDKNSHSLNKQLIRPNRNLIKGRNNQSFIFYNCVSGNTIMFKKELIPYILPIPQEVSFHDIWIAFVASSIGTIDYTDEAMIYYRRYPQQITKTVKKNYSSPLNRFKEKNSNKIKIAQSSILHYEALQQLPRLDEETKDLLSLLINHYLLYNKGLFNVKLYNFLIKNKYKLFAIKTSTKHKSYAKKIAMKLKLHQLLLFSS